MTTNNNEENIQDNENFEEIIDELEENQEEENSQKSDNEDEILALKDSLARVSADFENFKRRTQENAHKERISYTWKTAMKLIPSIDTLKRIIDLTPKEQRESELYKWLESLYWNFLKELESINIKPFVSKWEEVDPHKHEVMTQAPWKKDVIIDEFEIWYMIGDDVLRPAKVIVWLWE